MPSEVDQHPLKSWRFGMTAGFVVAGITTVSRMGPDYWWLVAAGCYLGSLIGLGTLSRDIGELRTRGAPVMTWLGALPSDAQYVIGATLILFLVGTVAVFKHPVAANSGQVVSVTGTGSVGVNNGQIYFGGTSEQLARPNDERLPGFAAGTFIRIDASTAGVERTYFSYGTPDGALVELHQGRGNQFVFKVVDVKGDPHTVEIPQGSAGIPFGRFVYLFCEVGTASNYSYIRVMADGRQVARVAFDFPLDLGSQKWGLRQLGGSGAFGFTEMTAFGSTLPDDEIAQITANAHKAYGQ